MEVSVKKLLLFLACVTFSSGAFADDSGCMVRKKWVTIVPSVVGPDVLSIKRSSISSLEFRTQKWDEDKDIFMVTIYYGQFEYTCNFDSKKKASDFYNTLLDN